MAGHERVIEWALQHAERLNLRVTHYEWTRLWLPDYTDLAVKITLVDQEFVGRGTAQTENLAFIKAFAEAVERGVAMSHHLKTTNGVAAHTDSLICREKAIYELIERDWFLSHFIGRVPLEIFPASSLLSPSLQKLIQRLEEQGIDMVFSRGPKTRSFDATPVACIAFGERFEPSFGLFLGLGCDLSLAQSVESAALECLRNLLAHMNQTLDPSISIEEFLALNRSDPKAHLQLGMNLKYAQKLRETLLSEKEASLAPQANTENSPTIETMPLEILHPELQSVPLVFYRAYSGDVQDLFFGPTHPENVNIKRISALKSQPVSYADLLDIPHPVF